MNKKDSSDQPDSGDKALWDLLGCARKTKAGPMFSRNVAREVRLLDSKGGLANWLELLKHPAVLAGTAAVIVLLALATLFFSSDPASLAEKPVTTEPPAPELFDPTEEMETIETLGELMAVSDPGTLSDEALMALLF